MPPLCRPSCALFLLVTLAPASFGQTWIAIDADAGEEQLEKALAERGSVDFADTPLHEVADRLARQFQVQILLSAKKLQEASVSAESPITKKLDSLPLESILRLVLGDLELGIMIRDGVISITTPEDIESQLITRIYPALDLVKPAGPNSNVAADYDSLIGVIIATIQPDSWDDVGGPGAIDALDNAKSLVISQTRDVHRQVETLLISLRRAKAIQGIPSLPLPTNASNLLRSRLRAEATRVHTPATAQAWQLPKVHAAEQ